MANFDFVASKTFSRKICPSEFLFINITPLSRFPEAAVIIFLLYCYFGGRFVISTLNLPVIKLNGLFQIHNLFLTSLSLTLLVLILEQIIPIFHSGGSYHSICSLMLILPN